MAELVSGASRPCPLRLDPGHRTQPTRLGAQREGTSSKQQRSSKRPRSSETEPPRRPTHSQRGQKRRSHQCIRPTLNEDKKTQTWRPVRPYIPRFQRLAPPHFLLRPPSSSCGKLPEKGRALSPPPRAPRGGRENYSWHRSREIHSPKIRPPPYMTFDL